MNLIKYDKCPELYANHNHYHSDLVNKVSWVKATENTNFPFHLLDQSNYEIISQGESFQDNEESPQYAIAVGEKTILLDIPLSVLDHNRT